MIVKRSRSGRKVGNVLHGDHRRYLLSFLCAEFPVKFPEISKILPGITGNLYKFCFVYYNFYCWYGILELTHCITDLRARLHYICLGVYGSGPTVYFWANFEWRSSHYLANIHIETSLTSQ